MATEKKKEEKEEENKLPCERRGFYMAWLRTVFPPDFSKPVLALRLPFSIRVPRHKSLGKLSEIKDNSNDVSVQDIPI